MLGACCGTLVGCCLIAALTDGRMSGASGKESKRKLQDTNIADRQVQILMYLRDIRLLVVAYLLVFVSAFALIFCLLGGKYQS